MHKTQPNRDSIRGPLIRQLPVHNLALSRMSEASCTCYSSTGHAFVEAVWRHFSVYLDIGEPPGYSEMISDSCAISHFGPCAFRGSPEKKRLIQL